MQVTRRFGLRAQDALNRRDFLKGISAGDVGDAARTGFDAGDVEALRLTCAENLLMLTIRCPKLNTRHAVGKRAPKPASAKGKSDEDGLGGAGPSFWVSDYDLMGVFQFAAGAPGRRYERIVTTKPVRPGAKPEMTEEFKPLFDLLNSRVAHDFQHGANDDYRDAKGQIIVDSDELWGARYVAFTETAHVRFLPSFGHLHQFYAASGIEWPYGAARPKYLRQYR